jgi:hypothetical protein
MGYKDSANLYAFAGGDPVNGRDPSGLQEAKGTPLEEQVEEDLINEKLEERGIDPLTGRPIEELREEELREETIRRTRERVGLGHKSAEELTPEEQEEFIRNARRLRTDPEYRARQERAKRELQRLVIPRDLREKIEEEEATRREIQKRGPKPWGQGPHNQTIAERINQLKEELGPEWEHVGGGDLKEEYIPTPGGAKSARRPDITFRNRITGEYYRENVGKTYENGDPIKRETDALNDLQRQTGKRPKFTAYDKPKPK